MKPDDTKKSRQRLICELITNQKLHTHEDLIEALYKMGIQQTQATISRDLLELGIVKQRGIYMLPSSASQGPWQILVQQHVRQIKVAGDFLIVLKVDIGAAHLVAVEIEKQEWTEIVGVIAGDDTLFIALNSKKDRDSIYSKLHIHTEK